MRTFYSALVPALWLIWLAIWLVAAIGAKRTVRRESLGSRLGYNMLMLAGAVVLAKPDILGPTPGQGFDPHTFGWFLAGAVLVFVGLAFSIVARVWLGRNWSGIVTVKQSHELIRSGPYALVRHPIYSGMLLAFIGTAIVIDCWSSLVALAALLAALLVKIRKEEHFMAEAFGAAYARYRAEVPALAPFVF
jgi:protein-S-isoprenylcysteine O-methyltransferase Ste14